MIQLTADAVANAALLRALYGDPPPAAACETFAQLAALVQRDPSNLRRSVKSLQAAGLLAPESGGLPVPPLTEAGVAMVEALDRAERGRDAAGDAPPEGSAATWPHDRIVLDPKNRKSANRDIPEIAASIASVGVLEPVLLSPADRAGFRKLRAGHRRWLGVEQNILAGVEGFGRDYPMPFIERETTVETDAAEQALVAIVENGQRVDMTPLETARAFQRLIAETGWSAREAARRTGMNERVVQEGQRVLAKAAPEDLARHEAEPDVFTWEQLRDSVKQLELSPKMALLIVEIADRCEREPSKIPGWSSERGFTWCGASPVGGAASELESRGLIEIRRSASVSGECAVRVVLEHPRLKRWLDDNGFSDNRAALLREARAAVVGLERAELLAHDGRYVTDWLNAPSRLSALDPQAATPPAGRSASSSPGWTSPPDPAAVKRAEALSVEDKVALLELAHSAAHGRGVLMPAPDINGEGPGFKRAVPAAGLVGKDLPASLFGAGGAGALIQVFGEAYRNTTRAVAALTHAGRKVVHALAPGLQSPDFPGADADRLLDETLRAVGLQPPEGRYVTGWLNEDWELGTQADLVKDLGHAEPDAPQLSPRARLALVELRHKIIAEGVEVETGEGAVIGAYWLGGEFTELTKAGLARAVPRPGQRFLGAITNRGLEHLAAHFDLGMGGIVGEALLDRLRGEVGQAAWPGPGYVTAWLNVDAAAPPADAAELPPPNEAQIDIVARAKAEAEAKQAIVDEVDRFIRLGHDGFSRFFSGKRRSLLEACFGPAPYAYDPDHGCFVNGDDEAVFDLLNQLDADDVQHAGGRLLEAILARAVDGAEPEAADWDAVTADATPLQALVRAGKLIRDLMIRHYDILQPDPDCTLAYRHLSEAIQAGEYALKAEAQTAEAA